SARAHFDKLSAFVPAMTPEHLLSLTDEEMRHCQISRQKSRYLKALANAVVEGHLDLESLPDQPEDLIRAHLTRVPGIGGWTCDIYLMFCLQKKDILPLGDVAILSAVTSVTGLTSKEAISERSQLWKPLRTLASFYLWHAYLRSRNRPVIL
ncbi:MAG: DNA-3-methyladenine glycosylase 2 family protein, partial [Saprospiraceae bacterium]|nr:DNA-3-methyladenine glycosylase 2 family protein [Saprospiraceae bacterium]